MLNLIDGMKFEYRRRDGLPFTLKHKIDGVWQTIQVGETINIDRRYYKVLDIKTDTVLLELLPLTTKKAKESQENL